MNPAPTISVGAGTPAADPPNPNHPEPSLRTLPFSSIKVYKNGELLGTVRTFRNILFHLLRLVVSQEIQLEQNSFLDSFQYLGVILHSNNEGKGNR